MSTAYDGNSLATRQADTRRTQDPWTGQINTNSTVPFYLYSSALGGQVVAELDAQGNKTGSQIYFQGMQLAKETIDSWPSTQSFIQWFYTDPVTGSNSVVDQQALWSQTTELDPLGANVTSPPSPPLADTYQLPDYMQPIKQSYYQIEGTPSVDSGVSKWYVNMVNKDFDAHMAQLYWDHGFRDWAQEILENNPNVGVHVTGGDAIRLAERAGVSLNRDGSITVWGARAAYALGFVDENNRVLWPDDTLTQDDPETITSKGSKNCKFTISFKSGTFYENNPNLPNGPGEVQYRGKTYFGLGFTVEGKTHGGGGIGRIGSHANPNNPKGQWTLDLYTSSYAKQNGAFVKAEDGRLQQGGEAWQDIDLTGFHFATDWTNKFSRYDHPSLLPNIPDTYKNQSFLIKVFRGNELCQAEFHIVQRGNSLHWGKGAQGKWPQ
jgi:hypothetical protein